MTQRTESIQSTQQKLERALELAKNATDIAEAAGASGQLVATLRRQLRSFEGWRNP